MQRRETVPHVQFSRVYDTLHHDQVDGTPRPYASRAPTPNRSPAEMELEQLMIDKDVEEARVRAITESRNARIAELQARMRHAPR